MTGEVEQKTPAPRQTHQSFSLTFSCAPTQSHSLFIFYSEDLPGKKPGKCKRGNCAGEASHCHCDSRREIVEKSVRIQAREV